MPRIICTGKETQRIKRLVKELMNTDSYANGIHLLNLIKITFGQS